MGEVEPEEQVVGEKGTAPYCSDPISLLCLLYNSVHHIPWSYPKSTLMQVSLSPAFPKFALHHLAFTKDLHYYLFSLTEKYPKWIFTFMKKDEKRK